MRRTRGSSVETTPATRSYRYADYWGTAVTAFDLHAPHTELAVTATSVVETAATLLRDAARKLDKAASKGVIHKNQAANRKSAITKKLTALTAA